MTNGEIHAIAYQLRHLQQSYAAALDGRDPAALLAVFHPDAVLQVFPPRAVEPSSVSHGHDSLGRMVDAMAARYEQTLHVLSNEVFDIERDTARGQVYCLAHHLIQDGAEARKFAAYILYKDGFRRDDETGWRFSRRDIHFLWAEESRVLTWDNAIVQGRLS